MIITMCDFCSTRDTSKDNESARLDSQFGAHKKTFVTVKLVINNHSGPALHMCGVCKTARGLLGTYSISPEASKQTIEDMIFRLAEDAVHEAAANLSE